MALQGSGAISMAQIAAEFGGNGSHSLSEYYPLVGMGVSGLPSSGAFSFSQFHGKSNQVTTSVWVSSGHNTSHNVWEYRNSGSYNFWRSFYNTRRNFWNYVGNWQEVGRLRNTNVSSVTIGIWTYMGHTSSGVKRYRVVTTWVDTSSYQNQTQTKRIST